MNHLHRRLLTATLVFSLCGCATAFAESTLPPVLLPRTTATVAPAIAPREQPAYRVQRGDSLDRILMQEFGLARSALKQWRAMVVAQNPSAFKGGNPNRLVTGALLVRPLNALPPAPITPPVATTPEQPRAPIYYYGH